MKGVELKLTCQKCNSLKILDDPNEAIKFFENIIYWKGLQKPFVSDRGDFGKKKKNIEDHNIVISLADHGYFCQDCIDIFNKKLVAIEKQRIDMINKLIDNEILGVKI